MLPAFVEKMVERKMIGEKTGEGFYKRVKSVTGESEILTLDPATLEYRPRKSPKLGSLEAAARNHRRRVSAFAPSTPAKTGSASFCARR